MPQSHPQTLLCRTAAASSRYPQLQQQVSSSRPATQRHVHTTTESYAAEDGQLATTRRQTLLLAAAVPAFIPQPAAAASKPAYSPAFLRAFEQALSIKGSWQDQDRAWSEVVRLGPDNAAAWSNRGTLRLQNQQWAAAYEDLQQAVALEQQQTGSVSAVVLNNLGNVEGALGRWQDAMQHYQQAAEDPEMGSIAGANYALAAWETGQDDAAIKAARSLLRRYGREWQLLPPSGMLVPGTCGRLMCGCQTWFTARTADAAACVSFSCAGTASSSTCAAP